MWGTIQYYIENWEFINPIGPRVDIIYLVYPRDLEFELNPKVDANGLLELGYPKSVFSRSTSLWYMTLSNVPSDKIQTQANSNLNSSFSKTIPIYIFFGRKLKYVDFIHTMPARTCRLTNFHRLIWTNFF